MRTLKGTCVLVIFAIMMIVINPTRALADTDELVGLGDTQMVSEGDIIVGDGVTATFDEETGEVVFYSDGGTLWKDWTKNLGSVTKIKVAKNEKVYLPQDSSRIFSLMRSLRNIDFTGFDLSRVTDMSYMFYMSQALETVNLSGMDMSSVKYMNHMFTDCKGLTSVDLSNAKTSNVRDMSDLFSGCRGLAVLKLDEIDTSNVRKMNGMFSGCDQLKELDLSLFDTSRVTDMSGMFCGCSSLAYLDLSELDTSSAIYMGSMFAGCSSLFSLDISVLDTSSVINMQSMFSYCGNLKSLNVRGLNTSNVENMEGMFWSCKNLKTLDLEGWDTAKTTTMSEMFGFCSGLTALDLSGLDTSNVERMECMFSGCSGLTTLDLSGLDTSNVENMGGMFSGCSGLTTLDLSGLDTSNVEYMGTMFSDCSGLTTLDLSGLDTSNVKEMVSMFAGCSELTTLNLSGLDTTNVTNMTAMFSGCSRLINLELKGLETPCVTEMARMFRGCSSLTTLDLSGFNTSSVIDMNSMFARCIGLTTLDISGFVIWKEYDVYDGTTDSYIPVETETYDMFSDCDSLQLLMTPRINEATIILPIDMFDREGKIHKVLPKCDKSRVLATTQELSQEKSIPSRVLIDKESVAIIRGERLRLTASVFPDKVYINKSVKWAVSDETVASIDEEGNITTLKTGTADITATTVDGGLTAVCKLTVEAPNISGISLDKETLMLKRGENGRLSATVEPEDAENKSVVWTSSDETVATVDAEGNIRTLKIGTADITATTVDGGFTAVCRLTVEEPNVSSISLDKDTLTLKRGESSKLTTTVEPADAGNKDVTWTSSDETVATVDVEGNITTLKIGAADITATTADGGLTAVCRLTVEAPNVSGISFDMSTASLTEGEVLQLTATMAPEDAGDKSVTWSSSDSAVAEVDASGLVKALKAGTADITATTTDGGFTAVCSVTVTQKITFTDVADPSAWYYDSVYWAVENGVTSGMGEGTFQPMAKLSRAQAVTFLYNLAGRPDVSGLQTKEFTDVADTAWYYKAVKWAVANKITSGYGTGTFQPNATCNRAMIVTFLMNYAKAVGTYKEPTISSNFKDVAATAWYKASVDWTVENGITSGYGQGTFSPNVTCNRAMMVTFLKKVSALPKV